MKLFIRNNFFILFFLTCHFVYSNNVPEPFIQIPAISQENKSPELKKSEIILTSDQFEQMLQATLNQIRKIGSILQSLADQLSNNQIKLKNKQAVLEHIMSIKGQIHGLEQQAISFVDQDISKISMLLKIIDFFTKHVDTFIRNSLNTIPELNLDTLVKRTSHEQVSVEEVSQAYLANEKLLKNVEKNANIIGLSRFNRFFRWFENINDKYRIPQRVFKTSALGLAAATVLMLLHKNLLIQLPGYATVIKPLKEGTYGIGDAPHFDKDNLLTNESELSFLGKMLANFGPHSLNLVEYVFASISIWKVFGEYIKDDAKKTKDWAEDSWMKTLNWLRGGAARKIMRGGKKEPSVTFNNGIGFEHIKYELYPYIEYFCRTESWDRANIAPQTGIIFAGKTRTGKTFTAEMLAGHIKQEMKERGIKQELTFMTFNAAEVDILGIDTILEYARTQAPCIIFIDEIDMSGWKREVNPKELSKCLTAMSGCMEKDINKRVIIIGATNKPESLDEALLQYGRFGKVIWFEYPTMQERMLFLTKECESRAIFIDPAFLEKLARETEHCSYDALHNIIATAAQKAKLDEDSVKQHHIELAFDEEIRQILVKNVQLPQHQTHTIALHLAGHALATHLLDGQKKISKVTIRPVKTRVQEESLWTRFENKKEKVDPIVYGKVFTYDKDQELSMPSYEDLIKECKIILAGHISEKIVLGESGYGYHKDDHKEALSVARYIMFKGIDPNELPKNVRYSLEEKAYELMKKCEQEIAELLTQKKEYLLIISEILEKQQILSGEEMHVLINLNQEQINQLREEIKKFEEQLANMQNSSTNSNDDSRNI